MTEKRWKPPAPTTPNAFDPPPATAPTRQAPGACILDPKSAAKAPVPHLGNAIEILHAAVADAMGRGWHPRPDAERTEDGARGWFTVAGKRFAIEVRLDYGEAPPTQREAEAEERAEKAEAEASTAEKTLSEVRDVLDEAKKDRDEAKAEARDLRAKNDAWFDTVYEATAGDGGAAVREAAKIPKEYKP
jgi:hypothetical protein